MRQGGEFRRVIYAQSLEIAEKIALAMLGEEVYRGQYLDEILSVERTRSATPHISTFNHDYAWERVLQAFGLQNTEIRFVCDNKGRKIGLHLPYPQIEQVFNFKL